MRTWRKCSRVLFFQEDIGLSRTANWFSFLSREVTLNRSFADQRGSYFFLVFNSFPWGWQVVCAESGANPKNVLPQKAISTNTRIDWSSCFIQVLCWTKQLRPARRAGWETRSNTVRAASAHISVRTESCRTITWRRKLAAIQWSRLVHDQEIHYITSSVAGRLRRRKVIHQHRQINKSCIHHADSYQIPGISW